MSVQPTPTAATSMLTVTIQMGRTTALVIRDLAAMENRVQVNKAQKKTHFVAVGQPRPSQHAVPCALVTSFAPFQYVTTLIRLRILLTSSALAYVCYYLLF